MSNEKAVFRKHLLKQIKSDIKNILEWIIMLWLLGGWFVLIIIGGALWLGEYKWGIVWELSTKAAVLIILVLWLGAWILMLIFWFFEWILNELRKSMEEVRENAEKELQLRNENKCLGCEEALEGDSEFCSNCGEKTSRMKQLMKQTQDSSVWHY